MQEQDFGKPLMDRIDKVEKRLDNVDTHFAELLREVSGIRENAGVFMASIQVTLSHINEHYDRADREMAAVTASVTQLTNRVTEIEKSNIAHQASFAANKKAVMLAAGAVGAFAMWAADHVISWVKFLPARG